MSSNQNQPPQPQSQPFSLTLPAELTSFATASGSPKKVSPNGVSTPPRRRSGAPTSIPNFPNATDHRESQLVVSPIQSPGSISPFKSPPTPSTPPAMRSSAPIPMQLPPPQPFGPPSASSSGSFTSPWHALAATSGAPTPSIDGPGRNSPHLGGPFEKLNIDGSWSGGNLWADSARRASLGDVMDVAGPSTVSPMKLQLPGGINPDMLAKYRNMAGQASASGRRDSKSSIDLLGEVQPMEGIETQPTKPVAQPSPSKPPLPAALARRRASLPKAGLGILPPQNVKLPSPLGTDPPSTSDHRLRPISTTETSNLVLQPNTLVLDLRPPSAFLEDHLPNAHSIPIPSTLLRRPNFTLAKMIVMLSPSSQDAVKAWKTMKNIILVDVDSLVAADGSILQGLASKFEKEGYKGRISFVKGGQTALEEKGVEMVSNTPNTVQMKLDLSGSGPSPSSSSGHLMAGGLGSFAFQTGSTGSGRADLTRSASGYPFTPSASNNPNPFASFATSPSTEKPLSLKHMNLDNGSVSSKRESSGRSLSSGSTGKTNRGLQAANPFFDNIRQNLELSHGGITERIPLQLPQDAKNRTNEMPPWLSELVSLDEKEVSDRLAQQFYQLERNEQKRLQAVMDYHTQGSGFALPATNKGDLGKEGVSSRSRKQKQFDKDEVKRLEAWSIGIGERDEDGDYYPFSITAGIERGSKNRYKNIWPYDFSRVRLERPCDGDGDYINANFIQPRGTTRRYIATQGPLDATYKDFWTLIWEQDVRVIVMLTKQFEAGQTKCGNYWQDQEYGPLRLHLEKQSGGSDDAPPIGQQSGFNFGFFGGSEAAPSITKSDTNIRRDFLLSHKDGKFPSRKVVQIQCVAWPDFDVPESPDILVDLMRDVDHAVAEVQHCSLDAGRQNQSPVLVHCSAGVGRTGSFIVVDSILDALTRERKAMAALEQVGKSVISLKQIRRNSGSEDSLTEKKPSPTEPPSSLSYPGIAPSKSVSTLPSIPDSSPPMNAVQDQHALPEINKNVSKTILSVSPGLMSPNRKMDVDPFSDQTVKSENWTKYREEEKSESGSVAPGRPSFSSSKMPSFYSSSSKNEDPAPVSKSNARHRSPSPLAGMDNPILDVLESMRVQRMSLVQSLRQFVFVHRVIIYRYLEILDEEAQERADINKSSASILTSDTAASSRGTIDTSSTEISTTATSLLSEEDEFPVKRRASPTELQPEPNSRESSISASFDSTDGQDVMMKRVGSVKRMRSDLKGSSPALSTDSSTSGTGSGK